MKIKRLLAEKQATGVVGLGPDATIQQAAIRLIEYRIGALVICDEAGKLVGIVSERDLLPAIADIQKMPHATPVTDIMTPNVITCHPEDEVGWVLQLMRANTIRHMPVVTDGKPVDMISIRELTLAYEHLQKEADTDPLTQLSSRRPFLRTLEMEYAKATRFKHALTVAMIDIDHFKAVNDTYGHDAGDRVLKAVSSILMNEFRSIDFVGRLGGEEFGVIMPKVSIDDARISLERVIDALEAAVIPVRGGQVCVTASAGLAGISAKSLNGSDVLRQADICLYRAKRGGRNCVIAGRGGTQSAVPPSCAV